MSHSLFIKNMVCHRCVIAVENVLKEQGLHATKVVLGEATLVNPPTTGQLDSLDAALTQLGFERIDDKRARVIEKTKNTIISLIHHSPKVDLKVNWSTLLAEELHLEYHYLSSLFSSVEGITLEQYIIRQKIEKAKELLFYDELTLGEIAHRLGYSSVAHLSSQFSKVTGSTPTQFKKSRQAISGRLPLDQVG